MKIPQIENYEQFKTETENGGGELVDIAKGAVTRYERWLIGEQMVIVECYDDGSIALYTDTVHISAMLHGIINRARSHARNG